MRRSEHGKTRGHDILRGRLLRGASVIALVTAISAAPAAAQSLSALRAAVSANNAQLATLMRTQTPAGQGANTPGMNAAVARALQYQTQVSQAVSLAQQAQAAARQAVMGTSPTVPDGLVFGGLDPVANPVPAAQDTTGLNTWQGANLPTEQKTGKQVNVTVQQTQQRAVLSWTTFNVGANTTLTFDQTQNGVAEPGWIVLNRVVGQLNPLTGFRNQIGTPTQILGSIKADGTVLIIDQNGILFGGASQINVNSLIATSLEVGRAFDPDTNTPLTIKDRNDEFLTFGLLGYADQASQNDLPSAFTFSAQALSESQYDPLLEGSIQVDAGANIAADTGGYILLTGPKVENAGSLSASEGQVSLQSGREITLERATGSSSSADPNVRGFTLTSLDRSDAADNYVLNTGIIESPQGYISLQSSDLGAVINDGVLEATTSVSRNGDIQLYGGDIQLGLGSTIAINPDTSQETIPQDPVSLQDFKPSVIEIGSGQSRIEVQQNAMIYAPSGNISIGAAAGEDAATDANTPGTSRIFIDTGAVIDAAGLTNVLIPASRNAIQIHPVTSNDLQNSPTLRNGFLNGATVYVDPRISGVSADGVAWIGSPLIPAASYAQQVGVTVQELMTKGGNVTLGVQSSNGGTNPAVPPDVTVKSGAVIDVSGGWVTYQAGWVQTTQLIDAAGNIVNIADANPDDTFIGIYNGYVDYQPRWGISQTYSDPLLQGPHYEGQYTEGRDAGSLTVKGSVIVLDGTVYADAFPGPVQLADAQAGTASSGVYGDERKLQAAPSQLPSGGFLFVQALASNEFVSGTYTGGGDISLVDQANYNPVSPNLAYGQSISIDPNGNLVIPVRNLDSLLPPSRMDTISLSADALSGMGLSDLSLETSGQIEIAQDANVTLNPGGVFNAVAGRTITVNGNVSVPSGTINLQTVDIGFGSLFAQENEHLGSFDVVVNGGLSARGRWINDYLTSDGAFQGSAYQNGGNIEISVAPRVEIDPTTGLEISVTTVANTLNCQCDYVGEDISGSILLNSSSLLDVSGGGYVAPSGALSLSARGGNVALIDETNYFQLVLNPQVPAAGTITGFRVTTFDVNGDIPINPETINSRVALGGTILAAGFGGGGTFALATPAISFGDGTATTGTELPMDFFSKAGFANYDLTSYGTSLTANTFTNQLYGYNAVMATERLTVGAGQTLDLSQSYFALSLNDPVAVAAQSAALRNLQTGGNLYSVLTPTVPSDAWDRKAVNLNLGGTIELDVAKGGTVEGEAGGTLTVSSLDNQGTIRIPGGTITQSEILPSLYGGNTLSENNITQYFTLNPDGSIDENANSKIAGLTNGQLAAQDQFILLGDIPGNEGIYLAPGSVTDLSGETIIDPRATEPGQPNFVGGTVVGGGSLISLPTQLQTTPLFAQTIGVTVYNPANPNSANPVGLLMPEQVDAAAGATLNLSGASGLFDALSPNGTYALTAAWSNGGTLDLGNGGALTGATIDAKGGAPNALGGTLVMVDPALFQGGSAPTVPISFSAVSADQIESSGFDTFVAQGDLTSVGDVTLNLRRGFFLTSQPYPNEGTIGDNYAPTISSGGSLEIDAPYIALESILQTVSTPDYGSVANNGVTLKADQIDVMGAVLFDNSVANVSLDATGDVRFIGVEPYQLTLDIPDTTATNSLVGQLAANGNLNITAGQVYPTTGSTFFVTSTAADGTITFAKSAGPTPSTPYSAGGNLTIQAASIVQGGVVRVPIGSLTIGADSALTIGSSIFAPATQSVQALSGSITSVSANGLVIPYGTTTDQTEWFFSPSDSSELTAPPQAILHFGGTNVALNSGATVDISGGGDLYAYEFIPGTGGSRDVLDRYNPDEFTSNNGYQYPDGRQVYAIVPGLSSATAAAYDPIYSGNYSDLYSATNAGESVYLSAAPGLAAGWYTLLPAQYAMLPGGMRVVEQTGAAPVALGTHTQLSDGTEEVAGYFGTAGTNAYQSTIDTFAVQSQRVFLQYSDIALTSADQHFAALAASDGLTAPQLPIDAGRLILAPAQALEVDTTLLTTPGQGGRGAEVDISGLAFDIVSTTPNAPPAPGTIVLTADSLTNLDAASLLVGGVRTDNSNGTTSIDVTAQSIDIANDSAHPLSGEEMLFAVDGSGAGITLADGATILATGAVGDTLTGNYIIDGSTPGMTGQGALLRVSTGAQRLVTRQNVDHSDNPGVLGVGTADIQGTSVLLDSSGNLTVASDATLKADALALGAGQVTFTSNPQGIPGLVVTPALQALFDQSKELTISTPLAIAFSSGTYNFTDVQFDTPALSLLDGDAVTLLADTIMLANRSADAGPCGQAGAAACGNGTLTMDAGKIAFSDGTINTYGFGGSTTLIASNEMLYQGTGAFDVGAGALNVETPFIGDAETTPLPGVAAIIPSLALTSTGTVNITNPTEAAAPTVYGTPGSSLSINGQSVSISDSELRATAGTLNITSATSIDVSGNAVLETPGFSKTFGDSADPVSVSAPGGILKLTAVAGDINLGTGTLVSVGSGQGTAGTLDLSASHGNVILDGAIDASAPEGGGSLALDVGGPFDLSAFSTGLATDFSGSILIHSGTGNLTLVAGDTLTAQNVGLTADGGLVDIAGTINVSGTNGGEVDLFGMNGVTLESTALIDAHANGYARLDPRQATGGTVNIGTDGTGVITVDSGAVIDVAALQTADRLVPMTNNGLVYYTFVPGDTGGTVNFRAPVIEGPNGETVNVNYAGTIDGASSIVLEGFERFNLANIANDPNFVGVTINAQGQAVLNVGTVAGQGQVNFLADNAPGTIVQFVQDFDISSSYGNLGDLASQANFHARPGMELDFSGDIVLASNWNLGAGVVDTAAAEKAGYMQQVDPTCTSACALYVVPGDEAEVFSQFTTMVYRVGGLVTGEPGVLTLRAGGTLDLQGSITDGFFQFRDQTDPNYLNVALGGGDQNGNRNYTPYLESYCSGGVSGGCGGVGDWEAGSVPTAYISLGLPGATGLSGLLDNQAPYSAEANSPAALGSLAGGLGDPLGSAQLFPLVSTANGTEAVNSWSYRLVGGADLTGGAGGVPSVDPMRTAPGATGNVIVEGITQYSYSGVKGNSQFLDSLMVQASSGTGGSEIVSPQAWLATFLALNTSLDPNSYTYVDFTTAPKAVVLALQQDAPQFFGSYTGHYQFIQNGSNITGVTTTLAIASQFLQQVIATNFANGSFTSAYKPPKSTPVKQPTTATIETLVRSGTGNIAVAAAGDINLENGATPTYEDLNGKITTQKKGGIQLGGSAIYTAGHLADVSEQTVVDELTGQTFTIDPSAYEDTTNVFTTQLATSYAYGAGGEPSADGFAGVLLANPVYATGGGNVSLSAGQDVLSRRDVWQEDRLASNDGTISAYTWLGESDQPWRSGEIGDVTNIQVDPQLFSEGVGTLGGGNISVTAGRDISDLSVVADTTATTAEASTGTTLLPTQALWQFGGGNVTVAAGRNILGGRVDVGEGEATITAGGNITNAGTFQVFLPGNIAATDTNGFRLRVSDATASVTALGTVEVQTISSLGVQQQSNNVQEDLDAEGFFSTIAGVSIIADGSVTIDNQAPAGPDLGLLDTGLITPVSASTDNTSSAVYPGSLEVASLTGNLNLTTTPNTSNQAAAILLYPSPTGDLNLYAAGDIEPLTIAMEDADPGLLPGIFSTFEADANEGVLKGQTFIFPGVLPNTTAVERAALHNSTPTHLGDSNPVRIDAGSDILDMIISVPKQARITAGRDIVNMMFFGQNLSPSDITRIVAGRDIIGTTELVQPVSLNGQGQPVLGPPLPAVEGNSFVIGGPGSFFLVAGRNMGPFLNSANSDGVVNENGSDSSTGLLSYGGGILSVGNDWNPWLPATGANLYVLFGVRNGANYDGFRDYYLDPANLASLPGYLFVQETDSSGNMTPDRSKPLYAPILINWLQENDSSALVATFGTTNISFQQAYDFFITLPDLEQRIFLLDNVYFNELIQTSIPTGASYKEYSRGYSAVNLLFPASLGYTQNNLDGGGNGANQLVQTGNLDLRLSAIETTRGGNIYILGPGGRVLGGSTVATADQAARRAYIGAALYAGNVAASPQAASIASIPAGYEGILTLRGGSIDTFTDEDFLLNQSRLFTEDGGDIAMWSSNGNLNAGEGPKTSADFPPVVVLTDDDLYTQTDSVGGVTGAGIAAFEPSPGIPAPDVFLIAPRGTVDAGAAGVRVAGNLFVAALTVANANNFSVGGTSVGVPGSATVDVGVQTSASSASAAAAQAAQTASGGGSQSQNNQSIITVDVLGYAGGGCPDDDKNCRKK